MPLAYIVILITIFLVMLSIVQEMLAAASGGGGGAENDGALDLGLPKSLSFTFQLPDIPQEVSYPKPSCLKFDFCTRSIIYGG